MAKEPEMMTRQQVRQFDRWAIEQAGIPGVILMENAGRGAANVILERFSHVISPSACIFCGSGNNGGDGYVIARHLANAGWNVCVVLCASREKISGDAVVNLKIIENLGLEIRQLSQRQSGQKIRECTNGVNLVVDALFGTGLTGPLRPGAAELVEAINRCEAPVMAVDIPSGLDCDTGKTEGVAIRASFTVTFAAVKAGFIHPESREFTGEVYCADIGVDPQFRENNL